jgi:small-conductance mechanosensitive channel
MLMLIGILRWGIVLLLIDVYLTLVLGYFAGTREISRTLSDWFLSHLTGISQKIVGYMPNLLMVLVISIITFYLIRLSNFFFREISDGRLRIHGFYPDWAAPTAKLARVLILVLTAIIVFPYLPGSKSPAFQGISIFVGVLLSLGSSSAVANAVAGTILTYMRSFQIGDYVEVGTTKGEVVEKTLLVTRICTPMKEIVTIPNGSVMTASVTNYSAQAIQGGVILHTTITIGYDAPWRHIHDLLIHAALATSCILKEPQPFVLQTSLISRNICWPSIQSFTRISRTSSTKPESRSCRRTILSCATVTQQRSRQNICRPAMSLRRFGCTAPTTALLLRDAKLVRRLRHCSFRVAHYTRNRNRHDPIALF